MTDAAAVPLDPPPEQALFQVDLKENGGVIAPKTAEELHGWLDREWQSWQWFNGSSSGSHRATIDPMLNNLRLAVKAANGAKNHPAGSEAQQGPLKQVESYVQSLFGPNGLPHSSSVLGRRVTEIRNAVGPQAAAVYVGLMIGPPNAAIDVRDLESFRALGMVMRDRFSEGDGDPWLPAVTGALTDALGEYRQHIGVEKLKLESFEREQHRLQGEIASTRDEHVRIFTEDQRLRAVAFKKTTEDHQEGLANVRKAFREEMALQSPTEYWKAKKNKHWSAAKTFGGLTATAIVAAAIALGAGLPWIQPPTVNNGAPDSWRLGVMVLCGVFVVWGVRLLVKLFLSQLHLAQDAEERVTMVTTYLSLQETGKLNSDKDRELILQSLFRPSSDGIVKDEGLPPTFAEMVTRSGGGR